MTDEATIFDYGESHTQSGDNKEVKKGVISAVYIAVVYPVIFFNCHLTAV